MPVIASLSSIPSRFADLQPVLDALLRQDAKLDEVRLYIPKRYRRFPDYGGQLPDVPKGVRLIQVEEDLGPASKVLFAAKDLAGEDCDIFFCDDDQLYRKDWVSRMLRERGDRLDHCVSTIGGQIVHDGQAVHPGKTPLPVRRRKRIAYQTESRVRRAFRRLTFQRGVKPFAKRIAVGGYVSLALGVGGVLVRPEFFDQPFYDIPDVLWTVDDYWLSGHLARRNIPIWIAANFVRPIPLHTSRVDALYRSVIEGADRDEANASCVRYMQQTYGVWLP